KSIVEIDWEHHAAACLPTDWTGMPTATIELSHGAYNALVNELRRVLDTGHASSVSFGSYLAVWNGMTVHIPSDTGHEHAYKMSVAWWAMGRLFHGGN